MANLRPYPGTPRWVKISAAVAAVLVLLLVIMLAGLGGRHGPGRHVSAAAAGDQPLPSQLSKNPAPYRDELGGNPGADPQRWS